MWVLVLINTIVGSAIAIPGYSSQATCTAAGTQEIDQFGQATGNSWVSKCIHPT